ncbi:PUA-like domain-containing protein [Xylariaceae sp. FL0804]|nr:PUA-like domain-containing protein [Xylariaceae sp. FL0804]
MTTSAQPNLGTVAVPAVGDSFKEKVRHAIIENRSLVTLSKKSINYNAIPPADTEDQQATYRRARMHLQWLDSSVDMTRRFKEKTSTGKLLEAVLDNPAVRLPEDIMQGLAALREKWEAETISDEEMASGEPAPEPSSSGSSGTDPTPTAQAGLPASDHAIYGEKGIMYGIIFFRGESGRRSYRLNPQIPARKANVFGHNEIPVGTWFANQLVALHRGAHGSKMGGIYGNVVDGAYSILVSSKYDDLDLDRGDVLMYSGSNSHANTDRDRPAPSSNGTKNLQAAFKQRRLIRVLRSGNSTTKQRNRYLPDCGIRYDGLYRIVKEHLRTNEKGGLYEQFVLQREPGQPPLEELIKNVPTHKQRMDLKQVHEGY